MSGAAGKSYLLFYLAGQNDKNLSEDLNEVDEELDGVADEVVVSATLLLNDHLGVPNDESTEEKKTSPKINLLKKDKNLSKCSFLFVTFVNVTMIIKWFCK